MGWERNNNVHSLKTAPFRRHFCTFANDFSVFLLRLLERFIPVGLVLKDMRRTSKSVVTDATKRLRGGFVQKYLNCIHKRENRNLSKSLNLMCPVIALVGTPAGRIAAQEPHIPSKAKPSQAPSPKPAYIPKPESP